MTTRERTALLPPPAHRGKVRDVYDLGEKLLLVATDRLSAFDVVLNEPIPDKGRILCGISEFWFRETEDVVPNHLLSTNLSDFPEPFAREASLAGRAMLVHKAKRVDVECVVRGYLAGSAWAEYTKSGLVSGIRLPSGLHKGSQLPEPIFTPTTKADQGHDEPLSFQELEGNIGAPLARRLRELSLAIYERGHRVAKEKGFLVADTKFEFGHWKGDLIVIDELLTPDSSRYWRSTDWREGHPPESWDKQVIRDFLEALPWNKEPPAPHLPTEIIHRARERYLDVYRAITGRDLPQ